MSFKRDGNDTDLLKNLQHRRVAEILGDFIPDDEAALLSNGRLTCTVCSKRPIFDTMQMLSFHRKGKKHMYELSKYLQYKRELDFKKAKQTQKSFLKTGQITIEPRLPCSTFSRNQVRRKSFSSVLNRKLVLDITESCDRIRTTINAPSVDATSANSEVRKYLKSLARRRPLEKTVSRLREGYDRKGSQGKEKMGGKVESTKVGKSKGSNSSSSSKEVEYQIKLLESGWIQDGSGKWVKDPEVEFDTDEDEPPVFQK